MKKLILLLLFVPLVSFGQTTFSNGYVEGFKKGYCMDDIACTPPISSIPSIPKIGEGNTYSDGYARGVVEGRAKRNNSSSSGSGAYENPKYIKPIDYTTSTNNAINSFNQNFNSAYNAARAAQEAEARRLGFSSVNAYNQEMKRRRIAARKSKKNERRNSKYKKTKSYQDWKKRKLEINPKDCNGDGVVSFKESTNGCDKVDDKLNEKTVKKIEINPKDCNGDGVVSFKESTNGCK